MSPERYKAELEALARETCDACEQEYPVAEMFRCSHCDFIYCVTCFRPELNCCGSATCLYQAANRLRELRDAAITVLEEGWKTHGYRVIGKAIEILKGAKQ